MNILLAYATNSGSTFLVTQEIARLLAERDFHVELKRIEDVTPEEISAFDLVFFGSNSWDFQSKEGQPHHAFMQFLERAKDVDWAGKKFIIFGCGDKTYQYFCGALDVISKFIQTHGGTVIGEKHRIDRFFFHSQADIFSDLSIWLETTMAQVE